MAETTSRFMAAAFTQAWPEGHVMPQWYQHVTIFPWARGNAQAAANALRPLCASLQPITAICSSEARIGAKEILPVWLLEPEHILVGLHRAIVETVSPYCELENDSFIGDAYRPHVTIKESHPRLHAGSGILIQGISFVDKTGDDRIIVRHVMFGAGETAA